MSFSVLPVAIIVTNSLVVLFADTRFKVVFPVSVIIIARNSSFSLFRGLTISINSRAMSELQSVIKIKTYSIIELPVVSVSVWVHSSS